MIVFPDVLDLFADTGKAPNVCQRSFVNMLIVN